MEMKLYWGPHKHQDVDWRPVGDRGRQFMAGIIIGEILAEGESVHAHGMDLPTTAVASLASSVVPAWWIASRAPAPARPKAIARPISRRAPVTSAVRPVKRNEAKGSDMVKLR